MSDATAPSPMRSLLLAILMITSTMTAALTTPWLVEDVRGDATYDGSDASDNSSQPSQVTSFNMQLNGTLDSSDTSDWYFVELFSGDSVDISASCMYQYCGTTLYIEPGTQSTTYYNLTTNSSDSKYSFTNYASTSYNLTFGFENLALQNYSTYLFTIDMTPSNSTGGGNGTNGSSQDDMGTGGDVSSTQATSFFNTHSGTVGGNDTYDTYWVYLYSGDEIEFDANCADQNGCYIMLMANVASTNQSTYYNLTSNYSDSVFTYSNNLTSYDVVSFSFMSMYNTPEDYDFYIQIHNSNGSGNGTGGNGTGGNGSGNSGNWSPPTLSLNVTELTDHGTFSNYSIVFDIAGMQYNHSYTWDFTVFNETMDITFEEWVEYSSGNTSVSIEGPENFQGGGTALNDGCYIMRGFVFDETAQRGVHPVVQYLSVGGGDCTTVFVDVMGWPSQSGDPIMLDLMFVDLDLYSNYTVSYEIKNDTSLLSSGNLTTYAESDMYNQMYNVSSQGLAVDCYEIHVELYDSAGSLISPGFSHVSSSHFEVGFPSCHDPEIYVWTDSYSYNTGDFVEVTIEAVHLKNEDIYNVHWSLYDEDGNWENSSSFNISNSEWYEDYFMIWDLSTDGCYELHVNLSDDNLMHLDSDSYEFEIGPGLCGSQSDYPWIDVWTDYDFDSGDNVSVDYAIGDLTMNHSYFIEWELRDKENWNSIDYGEESLGTPNVLYWESDIDIGSLGDGCYLFEASLYVIEDGTGIWLDHSDTEFGVGADADCNPLDVWIDGKDFDSGDNASFAIFVDNMMNMSEHTIRIKLHKQHFGLDSTSQWNFTAYGESTELYWDFGPLEDGCYDIQVAVASDDGDFARSGHGFKVGDVNCAHPWIEMDSDGFVYDDDQLVHFNMTFYDFPMNQSLSFDYEFWNDFGTEFEIGEFSITINEPEQAYTLNLNNLSDGCYYLTLMPHDAEDMNDYWAQFAVGEILDDDGEVISCWYPSVHIDTLDHTHEYSENDIVNISITIEDLIPSSSYDVSWQVHNAWSDSEEAPVPYEDGEYTISGANMAYDELSLGPFSTADGECLELEVVVDRNGEGWEMSYSDWRFEIGDADCWPPQLDLWAHADDHYDDNGTYTGSSLELEIRAWDIDEGQNYYISWDVYDEDENWVVGGEEERFTWNHDIAFNKNVYNISDGCYNIVASLYDSEWNLLSEDEEEKIGLGEVNCWAEPGIDFNYDDSRGQLQFHVWDLRHNDTYQISYEIYEIDSSGNQSNNIGGGSFEFTYNDYDWNGINTFVSLDEGEYWVEVTLSEGFGGDDLANSDGHIDVGDNSEEVWLRLHEDNLFATGAQIEFEVGVGNLDDETDYLLEVKLVKHTRDSRDIIDEYSVSEGLTNGYHTVEFNSPTDGTYDLEVQLFDSETDEFLSSDGNMICVGDGCPTGENMYGEAKMKLTVNWPDRPGSEENNMGDCDWMEVELIPEQRWLDYEDGNAIYGAYPDWKEQDHMIMEGESFTQFFEFEFYELPVGDYYVNVRVHCSGEIDGEWIYYQGFTDVNDDTWVPTSLTADEDWWNWTYHTVDLKTDDHDHHDGGDDDGLWDFVEPYLNSSSVSYRVTVKQGPNGPELHVEMGIPLNTDIITEIDREMGNGDGLLGQEELDELMSKMMEGDNFDWNDGSSGFYWDGMEFGANEFQVDGERIWGLVEGEPYYAEFIIFNIPITGTPAGTFGLFPSEQEGQPICEDGDMPEDWSVVIDVFGADGWTITDAPESFTADEMGHHKLSLDCDDVFPGTLDFDMEYDENGSGTNPGTDPGTDPEPVTNTPPVCVIEWYRDGDDLTTDGMMIFSASDGVESIQVSAGDTFSVYFECSDADGDEMNLKITPPFGSEVNYSAEGSVNRFVQLTIPSGTQGNFDFSAEWSDAASGGEYEFQVSITAPEDGNGEETEEDSTSAASFVPGFSAVLSFTAVLGAVILLALRRDEEE